VYSELSIISHKSREDDSEEDSPVLSLRGFVLKQDISVVESAEFR
jgi:hypothetical protein